MNIAHTKAVYVAGMQSWLSDKRSILMRLVLWPNLVPVGFTLFLVMAIGVMFLRSSPGGDMSVAGGISFTIYGNTGHEKAIGALFEDDKTRFTYVKALNKSEKEVKQSISGKEITFALNVTEVETGNITIDIVYDRQRDYVHMKWLEQVKERGADIALTIRKSRFSEMDLAPKILDFNLAPIELNVLAYGSSGGSMVVSFLVFLLWSALLVAPLDSAASVVSTQMISDTEDDFLSIWKSAGVKSHNIVLGRFFSALTVFSISMLALFSYVFIWVNLYLYIVDMFVGVMNERQLQNEQLHLITKGFTSLMANISIGDVFNLLLVTISTASLVLIIRIRLSIYVSDAEKIRTKFKPVEFILYNIPLLGFIIGVVSLGNIMFVPVINLFMVMQHTFVSGVPFHYVLVALMSNLALVSIVLYSTNNHIGNQNRLMMRY